MSTHIVVYLSLSILCTGLFAQPVLMQQASAQAVSQAATAGYLASQSSQQARQATQTAQSAQIASSEALSSAQFASVSAGASGTIGNGLQNQILNNNVAAAGVNGVLNAAASAAASSIINGQFVNGAVNGQIVNGVDMSAQYVNGAVAGQFTNGISGAQMGNVINGALLNNGINAGQFVNGINSVQSMNQAATATAAIQAAAAQSIASTSQAAAASLLSGQSGLGVSSWDTSLGATWGLDILPEVWSKDAYPYSALLDASSLTSWSTFANGAWGMIGQQSANWDDWSFKNFNNNWLGDCTNNVNAAIAAGAGSGPSTMTNLMQIPSWVDQSAQTTWSDWSSLFSSYGNNGYGGAYASGGNGNGNGWNQNNNWQSSSAVNGQAGQWANQGQAYVPGQFGVGPGQWGEGQWSPQYGYGSGQGASSNGVNQGNSGWGQGASDWSQGSSGWGQGANGWGQGASGWGQGANGWGQGSNGWGQGSSGQGSSGWGQGQNSNGWGQGVSNGWGQGISTGWGQGANGWGQSANGWGQGSNGWGQGSNGWGQSVNGWGQGANGYYSNGYANGYGVQQGAYGQSGVPVSSQCVSTMLGATNQTISCPAGSIINAVQSAAYGQSPGVCPNVATGGACTLSVTNTIQRMCVNQNTCSVTVSSFVLGAPTNNGQTCSAMNGAAGQTGYGQIINGIQQQAQVTSDMGYTLTVQYTCGIAGPGLIGVNGALGTANRSLTFSDATARSSPTSYALLLAMIVIAGMAI